MSGTFFAALTCMKTQITDQTHLSCDSQDDALEIVRQSGNYVYSARGKKYVDFTMGWCVGNFGWDNAEIKKRVQEFRGPDYVMPKHKYKPWQTLSDNLARLAPGKLQQCYRATGGTEAVEIALQTAIKFTERRKFISVADAYHGNSLGTHLLVSDEFEDQFDNPFWGHRMQPPFDADCASQVEKWLSREDIAAVIMEPIVIARGVQTPTQEFMDRVQAACKKHGSLLIVDEVATGFGRTGKIFASEHFNLEPDIMCLAKAITGGFAPMGATLMTNEVAQAVKGMDSYYSTYGWHPLAVEAAIGVTEYLDNHWKDLEGNIREVSNYIVDQLSTMKFKSEPRIAWKGLAICVQFEKSKYGEEIKDRAKDKGLLMPWGEKGFAMYPALTIDPKTVDEGLDILRESL